MSEAVNEQGSLHNLHLTEVWTKYGRLKKPSSLLMRNVLPTFVDKQNYCSVILLLAPYGSPTDVRSGLRLIDNPHGCIPESFLPSQK